MSNLYLPDGWKKSCLGDITENVMYGLNSKAINYDGKKKYIRITDIDDNNKFSPDPLTSPDGNADDRYKLDEGDLLFARTGATVGKSYLYNKSDGDVYFAGFLIRFHILGAVPKFVFLQTQTLSYWNWVKSVSMRSGQPGINAEEYKKLPLILPPLHIQESIVEYLEQWDTAIEKTEALIDAKERQFVWLVNHMVGKNQKSNQWQEYALGDLFDVSTHVSKSSSICDDGRHLIVDMGSISPQSNLIARKRTNLDTDMLQKDELVMPKDDFGGGNIIGKVAIIDSDKKYVCGDHVYRLKAKHDINTGFVKYVINSVPVNKRLRAKANGTSQLGLRKKDVLKQTIWLPDLSVQQNIANTLNTAQQETKLLKKLADQYRTQKRGLMQKLLSGEWHIKKKLADQYRTQKRGLMQKLLSGEWHIKNKDAA